ncbi:hypothetical protein ACNS7O_18800 (plasmid) [Haloferacaceae archaeon DSL9]
MKKSDTLRRAILPDKRTTRILVFSVGVTLALLLGILMVGVGMYLDSQPDERAIPQTNFDFTEQNVSVTDYNGTTDRTAVLIQYKSGSELARENVEIHVNGQQAFDIEDRTREDTDGTERTYNQTVEPWSGSGEITNDEARIVAYGEGGGGLDIEDEDGIQEIRYLQADDVVEVVWYGDDGTQMTKLQRYIVEGSGENADSEESG